MSKMLVNPEWPGKAAGGVVFILAVFEMLLWLVTRMMVGKDLIDKAPALLVLPLVLVIAGGAALLAWEATTRLIARLEFSDDEYRRFVEFRSWSI